MPQLKPTRGICLNRSHPLSRGLVGLWLFNEGSGRRVFDLSGNGNTGTFVGDTAWVAGKFGSATSYDGTGDYINAGNKPTLNLPNSLSFIAWIYPKDLTGSHFLIERRTGSGLDLAYAIYTNGDKFEVFRYDGSAYTITSTTALNLNQWNFVAFSTDTVSYLMQINRTQEGAVYTNKGNTSPTGSTYIGRSTAGSPNERYFNGLLDNMMLYNRALSASGIAQLYREPFCMFEEAMRPKLISGQIVNLAGSSAALSYSSATAKAMRKVGGNVAGTSDVTALLNLIRGLLNIERNWLREALFNGMTANAYKLGTTLSLGWFWVRVAGCSVLYRGSDMDEIDFVNILAVAEQDACEISPPSYISHNSGSTYFYVVRRFNNCGYQECTLAASVKVSIESNGELAEPQPNKVFDSGAELVDGNKIQLVWYYCPLEQKSQPMCFNVYYDGRTGQIDYENPLATIEYQGRKFYSYQSSALEAGKYLFAIRAGDAGGIENSSLARLRIQFDSTNPDAIDILSAEAV